jgi:hypothetical protein
VRPPSDSDADAFPAFEPPESAPALGIEVLRQGTSRRTVARELATGEVVETLIADDGRWRQLANGLEYESMTTTRFRIIDGEPLSARIRCERSFNIGRADWQTRVEVWSEQRSDAEKFYVDSACDAFIGDEKIFARAWSFDVERDLI